jgi:predicted nucleotidyltransferase
MEDCYSSKILILDAVEKGKLNNINMFGSGAANFFKEHDGNITKMKRAAIQAEANIQELVQLVGLRNYLEQYLTIHDLTAEEDIPNVEKEIAERARVKLEFVIKRGNDLHMLVEKFSKE